VRIHRGDLYWARVARPDLEPGEETAAPASAAIAHPHVVIQEDALNGSRLSTVVVCALTSNLHRMTEPGNVLLEPGEANLARQSVVVVSQVSSIEKSALGDYIGSLSAERTQQILEGMLFQQASFRR
jgi:mRNA interferase MazF